MTIIDDLKEIGLSGYEAKAYRALIEAGEQTGRQVAELSKVPPTRVFDILQKLQEKGLVQLVQQKPMVWMAIKPDVGLETFVERRANAYATLGKKLVSEVRRIRQEPEKKIFEHVTVQSGFNEVISTVSSQIKKSVKEVCNLSVGPPISTEAEIITVRAIRRGVKVRLIVSKLTDDNLSVLEKWAKEGWSIRYLPVSQEYALFVFDGKACSVVAKIPKTSDERVIVTFENEGLAGAMREYFNSLWERAKPLSDIRQVPR